MDKISTKEDDDELADLLLADLEEQQQQQQMNECNGSEQGKNETGGENVRASSMAGIEQNRDDGDIPLRPAKKSRTLDTSSTMTRRGGTCPPHPGFIGQICIRCGATKQELSENGSRNASSSMAEPPSGMPSPPPLALNYIHHKLEVSQDEAARLRRDTVEGALAKHRLLLILDLDHTLLHSTRTADLSPEETAKLTDILQKQDPKNQELYHLPYMNMWTKFRPGLRKFLSRAKDMYDLHVFTMGDKDYAAGIAAILDPDGKFFGGRVASSSDAGAGMVKDVDVLLGEEKIVVILDDTAGVWPKHQDNLLQVDRYIYFPACAIRFGREQSFLDLDTDEDSEIGTLNKSLEILKDVHSSFFKDYTCGRTGDVRVYLRDLRSRVLDGCCILFSRIIPQNICDQTEHPLWQLAVRLGAKCVTKEDEDVTHVVAAGKTAKCQWAKETNRFVVSPDWLWSSGNDKCVLVFRNTLKIDEIQMLSCIACFLLTIL